MIRNVNKTGARIMSLTADGTSTNICCVEKLGVNFKDDKPFFKSPTSPHYNIYFLLDAPHMLKLARGCFATHQLYCQEKEIRWIYVKKLHNLQKSRNFNLGNKLTNLHIDYHLKSMNVRLAAEVMSDSTAHCIDQLREDGYKAFQNSFETTEFIRYVNNVFDICNVDANKPLTGYKKPLCESNANEVFQYFREAKRYFLSITIDDVNPKTKKVKRKLAINTRSRTPFLGMIHNLTALEGLYTDYFDGHNKALYSFKFSQDHLETWFSCLRRGVGSNDNPSASEFKRLYRKLLVCHEITYDGNRANCISNETGILTISSEIIPHTKNERNHSQVPEVDFNYNEVINEKLEEFDMHLNAFAGYRIEKKIREKVQKQKEKCMTCIRAFQENDKVDDQFLTRKNISEQPCKSTVDIIKASNKMMFVLPDKEFDFESISLTILDHLDLSTLYVNTAFEHHNCTAKQTNLQYRISHKEHFILSVVKTYIMIKAQKIGSKIADEERGVYIRHTNKKLIHTSGQ